MRSALKMNMEVENPTTPGTGPMRRLTPRGMCKRLVASKEFDRVILAVIGVNCITLLVNNPLEVSSERGVCFCVLYSRAARGARGSVRGRVVACGCGARWAKRSGLLDAGSGWLRGRSF